MVYTIPCNRLEEKQSIGAKAPKQGLHLGISIMQVAVLWRPRSRVQIESATLFTSECEFYNLIETFFSFMDINQD